MCRARNSCLTVAVATAITVLAITAPPGAGEAREAKVKMIGRPQVVTGDTLAFSSVRVQLAGIQAPHDATGCRLHGAPFDCARIAATALIDLTAGTDVRCVQVGRPTHGLPAARCEAGGYDLSEGMTYTGWARAWPRGESRYRAVEDRARARGHGLWRDAVTPPPDWRQQ